SAQIREILISESAWEEMTCLFAPSLIVMQCKRSGFIFLIIFCTSW
ncbi:curli production assembly/transport protein CsgE, partial [Klebsiella pneumoniae subsp. pneumoniae]